MNKVGLKCAFEGSPRIFQRAYLISVCLQMRNVNVRRVTISDDSKRYETAI